MTAIAGKSDVFENDILKLVFWGTGIANLADNAASAPATSLYLVLHTADPQEEGNASSNECSYTGYTRKAVTRDNTGFSISGSQATLAVDQNFAQCTGGSQTATYFSITTSGTPGAASKILYAGAITPNIVISTGVIPQLTAGTNVNEG